MRLVARWSDGPETTPSLPPLGVTSARRLFRALACEEPEARRLWPERLGPASPSAAPRSPPSWPMSATCGAPQRLITKRVRDAS